MTATASALEPQVQDYRSPTVVLAPGVLFRAGQWLTIGSLVVIAALALFQVFGTLSYDLCVAGGEAPYACAMRTPAVTMSDFGVPLWLQEAWLDVPTWLSVLVLFADLVAAAFLVRPRTVKVDPIGRALVMRRRSLVGRVEVTRVPLEEALVTCPKEGLRHAVIVVARDGTRHEITGLRFGRARQRRIAASIEAAIARGV